MAANMTEEKEQDEEEGVFEITDFTNATPWERQSRYFNNCI